MGEIVPWLLGPAVVALALVFVVRTVIGDQKARGMVLRDIAQRRGWTVEDRPSQGSSAASLTLSPPEGGWRIVLTYPKKQSSGGRRAGWTTFHSDVPALSSGRLVVLPEVPGAPGLSPAAAMTMLGGMGSALLLRTVFGADMGGELGTLHPVAGSQGGVTLMAAPGTPPPRDPAALSLALTAMTVSGGAVIDRDGLRLRLPMSDESELEALADQGAAFARAVAAAL